MNYLKVPDSNIKLTDGSVVMLARFPGTKWVVHYGWYEYSGRRAMGWYFSSIPAQTVIPVAKSDLQLIVLVDQGQVSDEPESVGSPIPCPPSPCPPGPGPVGPTPPFNPEGGGLFPLPDGTDRSPVAYFTKNDKFLLDSSWISLPSIKYRDALSTIIKIPDGKVVKINNVDGKTRYYSWNLIDQRWVEKFYENDTEELLVDYYNKEEIDGLLSAVNNEIDDVADECRSSVRQLRTDLDAEVLVRQSKDQELQTAVETLEGKIDDISDIEERLSRLEDAVYRIQKIVATASDTLLVSQNGTLKDSGVFIGDDVIDEPSAYASPKTLATEKAVAKLVEDNVARWSSF